MTPFLKRQLHIIKRNTSLIIIALFILLAAGSQTLYDAVAPPFTTKIKAVKRDLFPEQMIAVSHFGFKNILADLYWIRAIQDFVAWNGKELFFLDYFRNISALDPRFEHPYLFAIWTIPLDRNDLERLDKVAVIADRGIALIPESWKIPYHLGTQYFLFTKSYTKAKEYLRIAAEKKDAPLGVYLNYSSFVINDVKGYRASYDLVKVIYDNTDDATLKKVIEIGLQKEMLNTLIERGIVAYKTTKGIYPKTIDDLTKENLVSLPESFTNAFTVTINRYNGSFKIEEKK